ncbi:MAG: DUF983 domain-containing protein [Alphaproteobacteria bacterium]|nr:DUF983 domain-containing protein [Alphaproteobacteria bacterium]
MDTPEGLSPLKSALSCKCPKCGMGSLYKGGLSLDLCEKCEGCGLNFSKNDSADGPAVFLIFLLGFLLVPLALIFEVAFAPPLWVHVVIWSVCALVITLVLLKPLKSYVIALQYKYRPGDWK